MHEATIAQSILDIASERFKETPQAITISTIRIVAGEFRNVDCESLQFAFDNLKTSYSGCQNCQLQAEVATASAQCRQCSNIYHPDFERAFRCTKCGDGIGKLISGEELDIVGIVLETSEKEQIDYARVN